MRWLLIGAGQTRAGAHSQPLVRVGHMFVLGPTCQAARGQYWHRDDCNTISRAIYGGIATASASASASAPQASARVLFHWIATIHGEGVDRLSDDAENVLYASYTSPRAYAAKKTEWFAALVPHSADGSQNPLAYFRCGA